MNRSTARARLVAAGRRAAVALVVGAVTATAAGCTVEPTDAPLPSPPDAPGGWQLTWSDEFDGPAGSPPAGERWVHDVGGHGWGNAQLEFDTDRTANAALDGDGHLVITARREAFGGKAYTSARLKTEGRFDQRYGRFEARIELPTGGGIWPAFWLLGSSYTTVTWPACGELDIMEVRGSQPATVHGSAHGPGYSGGNPRTGTYTLPSGDFADGFHDFAIEWSPGEAHWFVDGVHYHTIRAADFVGEQRWVFDDGPMFIILNVAVGGGFGGPVSDTTVFPQAMTVDHVRVYQAAASP